MAKVELINLVKRFGNVEVVHGLDLKIEDNEFIVLVGPSGCGKSTTLRMIAGLEEITKGEIHIGGHLVNDVPPKDRNIAMVFQNYALYPHMTVFKNMAFGLKMQKRPKAEIIRKVHEAAEILGLTPYLERKPAALSGGQRQRVAMGRAIVRKPEVFLFDEPLSNLDAQLRTQMRMELKKLHLKLNTTTIYVTHDQVEAMTLADRIIILKDGYIQQVGTPISVFEKPKNTFVAGFIGNPPMNFMDGEMLQKNGTLKVRAGEIDFPVPENITTTLQNKRTVRMGIRPDGIKVESRSGNLPNLWYFDGIVVVSETVGSQSLLELRAGKNELIAEIEGRFLPAHGEKLRFGFDPDQLHFFDPETGNAIR